MRYLTDKLCSLWALSISQHLCRLYFCFCYNSVLFVTAKEEKKEESEESDDDMGFGLFD